MKKIIYCLMIILIYSSYSLKATEWTILIYMAGDNGLYDYALQDIEEMELSQFGNSANIIVQMDGAETSDLASTYRYKISHQPAQGIQSRVLSDIGETDSGSYLTLRNFVKWGFKRYQSEKKALIIWSHGNGWSKDINEKGIAPDNTSQSYISMSNHEMQAALNGTNLDLLIYDACNMQSIENLFELKGQADFIIGSEDTVPATGLPYSRIFDYWQQAENLDSLVVNIPKIYLDSYRPGNLYNPGPYLKKVTSSTAKMEHFEAFVTSLNTYLEKWSTDLYWLSLAREELNEFGLSYTDIDLKELFEYLIDYSTDSELVSDSQSMLALLEEVFISYDSSSYDYKVGPASIWFPKYSYQYENYWPIYRNLNFAQGPVSTFLNNLFSPDQIPPFPFEITQIDVINESLYLEWENHHDPDPLIYYLHLEYLDNSSEVFTIFNDDHFIGRVKDSGSLYLVAEDAAENRSMTQELSFAIAKDYSKIYFAPEPTHIISDTNLVIYDDKIAGEKADICIFSISGKLVAKKTITLSENQNEHKINLATILTTKVASGIYICTVKANNKYYKTKLTIEN